MPIIIILIGTLISSIGLGTLLLTFFPLLLIPAFIGLIIYNTIRVGLKAHWGALYAKTKRF